MKIIYRFPTLFERLIYYFFLPELMAKIIYEIILRVPAISVTQPKQYMFYGLIAIEYIVLVLNYKSFKPSWQHVNPVVIILFLMIFQGILVGGWHHNPLSRIGIDTVNVFVVLANIILLSDPARSADTAFDRVFKINRIYGVTMVLLSVLAMAINSQSAIGVGSAAAGSMCISLLFAEMYVMRGTSSSTMFKLGVNLILIAATAPSWNRTALVFCGAALLILLLRKVRNAPFRVAYIAMGACAAITVAFLVIPEDSALSRRLTGLQGIDLSDRTGSIGEREAESDAVNEKIAALGTGGSLFGAGHGASYDVKYTWEWKLNYSNAHYGWVLFYLRYGYLGYVYMGVWIAFLMLSVAKRWRSTDPASILICLLAIWNIGYFGTYGYFSFFIAGLPFIRPASRRRLVPRTDAGSPKLIRI